jgi:hypothetical protein
MAVTSNTVIAVGLVLAAAGVTTQAQEIPPPPVQAAAPEAAPAAPPAPVVLSDGELRQRRNAIFLMEGVLVKAVRLGAAATAKEIQAIQPGVRLFSTAPVRAHGTYLEGYGVFFQVQIPEAMPSVVSLIESVASGSQLRGSAAQQTAFGGVSGDPLSPDAHYVESVKRQLIDAMLEYSRSLQLRPEEWLTVAARQAEEAPGQIEEPSVMVLRIQGADLAEFLAGRLTPVEVRRRVQVRGY